MNQARPMTHEVQFPHRRGEIIAFPVRAREARRQEIDTGRPTINALLLIAGASWALIGALVAYGMG